MECNGVDIDLESIYKSTKIRFSFTSTFVFKSNKIQGRVHQIESRAGKDSAGCRDHWYLIYPLILSQNTGVRQQV